MPYHAEYQVVCGEHVASEPDGLLLGVGDYGVQNFRNLNMHVFSCYPFNLQIWPNILKKAGL